MDFWYTNSDKFYHLLKVLVNFPLLQMNFFCVFSYISNYKIELIVFQKMFEPTLWLQCKQGGSRSANFFRSWLIRIYTVHVCNAGFCYVAQFDCESNLYSLAKNSK